MGKTEGPGEEWHGHVTALSIAPNFRRLRIANTLMQQLENVSDES